jgi:hypothetical protein
MDFEEKFIIIGQNGSGETIFISDVFNNKASALKCHFEYYKKMKKVAGDKLKRRSYLKDNFALECHNGLLYTGQIKEIGV